MKVADIIKTMKQYNTLRAKRLELDHQSEQIKAEEDMLRALVMKELIGRDKIYLEGDGAKAEIRMQATATVESWPELYHHIEKTGEFDLLHKAVTLSACRERWETGAEVPGVKQDQVPTCTISTLKGR